MVILFLKSIGPSLCASKRRRTGDEALEKIRIILQERVDEAETDEGREWAERELRKLQTDTGGD